MAKAKEMLAEGGSPWDRTDSKTNRNVPYFQGTVTEEACDTRKLWPNFFASIPEKLCQKQARETKTGTKEHGKTA